MAAAKIAGSGESWRKRRSRKLAKAYRRWRRSSAIICAVKPWRWRKALWRRHGEMAKAPRLAVSWRMAAWPRRNQLAYAANLAAASWRNGEKPAQQRIAVAWLNRNNGIIWRKYHQKAMKRENGGIIAAAAKLIIGKAKLKSESGRSG